MADGGSSRMPPLRTSSKAVERKAIVGHEDRREYLRRSSRRASSICACSVSSMRIQVEEHDVASAASGRDVHPIPIGLEKDLVGLTKGRRKKSVQRAIFRKQGNLYHGRGLFHLVDFMAAY